MEVIKRNLDGLAEAKIDVFHWHLSEDQGFRVESKLYPQAAGNGLRRSLLHPGTGQGNHRLRPRPGHPGRSGVRHSRPYREKRFVDYPRLAAAARPYQIERKFGVFDPSMDPSNEGVYKFLDGFIGEMAGLFPDEYFHIGGDEVNGKQWNQNPEIQRFMARQEFENKRGPAGLLQHGAWKILAKHHKKMMGWDEVLNPDLPKDILVQSWRGADGLADAAKKGYDTILSNGYYLDLCPAPNVPSITVHADPMSRPRAT